jgi:DUF4097 and DUF4098 domain-containing protein YvlB
MKKLILLSVALSFISTSVHVAAQEEVVDKVTVKLTDPAKPCVMEIGQINGGITVTGYDGQEVLVEAKTKMQKISEGRKDEKVEGMIRIPVNSSSLTVEEHNNRIEINTQSWKRATDVSVKIPKRASLNLSCINDGDILVENIIGDLEVSNMNGSVTLLNISGSVVAHALNEDLKVTLSSIDPAKPMSFSSMNGDIDVTFPQSMKCNVKVKNDQGDVYSDFEITKVEKPRSVIEENKREGEGKYRVRIESAFYGAINGGGPEFSFSNFTGDIYIRKGK